MQETMAANGSMTAVHESPSVGRAQMPLSFLGRGRSATIAKVRGKGDLHHHLEIKGSQVALNKQVATRIITQ